MSTNFSADPVSVFGMEQKLRFNTSGHYCIPIGEHVQSGNSLTSWNFEGAESIVLYSVIKLHWQFSLARFNRFQTLPKDTAIVIKELMKC